MTTLAAVEAAKIILGKRRVSKARIGKRQLADVIAERNADIQDCDDRRRPVEHGRLDTRCSSRSQKQSDVAHAYDQHLAAHC